MARLFFALWPDDLVRKQILQLQTQSGGLGQSCAPENLHATLAFLGEKNPDQLEDIIDAGDHVTAAPFTLELDTREWLKQSQICWLSCSQTPPRLEQLVYDLTKNLAPLGYTTDLRPFKLHVTLKRRVTRAMRPLQFRAIRWHLTRFVLVESVLHPHGPEYKIIHSWDFMG